VLIADSECIALPAAPDSSVARHSLHGTLEPPSATTKHVLI